MHKHARVFVMSDLLNAAGNPDRWYLDALPVGAVAEVDDERFRKSAAGDWLLDAKHLPPGKEANDE